MRIVLFILLLQTSIFAQSPNTFSGLTNTTGIPVPPTIEMLPDLEVVSSIITSSNALEEIYEQFEYADEEEYYGADILPIPDLVQGVWWRFYTQTTSLFNIPAVSEEILCIKPTGAFWLQDVKTSSTVHSKSQRRLQVAYYNLFDNMFIVFFYRDQNPNDQAVRDKQGYFIRVLSDKSYMQMSTSPNFEPEKSMYWRYYPRVQKNVEISQDLLQ